jgi:hypothetical protein
MSNTTTPDKPKRPLSDKQLAARRLNAQKSTGPRTPEGKARSSRNARKHGFFTQTALLFYEAPEDFVALRDSYIDEYQPQTPTEMHFVMEMANAQFRLRRVRGMEADLIQILITRELPSRSLSNGEMQAQAFRTLADTSNALHLLQRYEVMFRRQYERALRLLWEHRDRQRELSAPATPSQTPNRNFTKRTETRPRQSREGAARRAATERLKHNFPNLPTPSHRAAGAATPPQDPTDFPSRPNSPRACARATAAAQRLPPTVREGPTVPGSTSHSASARIPTVPPPAPQTLAPQPPPKPKTAILRNEPKPVSPKQSREGAARRAATERLQHNLPNPPTPSPSRRRRDRVAAPGQRLHPAHAISPSASQ